MNGLVQVDVDTANVTPKITLSKQTNQHHISHVGRKGHIIGDSLGGVRSVLRSVRSVLGGCWECVRKCQEVKGVLGGVRSVLRGVRKPEVC